MEKRLIKTLLDGEVLERTGFEGIETTIRKLQNMGSPGPLFGKPTQSSQKSHVWAASGARAQARRSTGDVLGGLPPEKPSGRSRAKTKYLSGSHSELLSRMEEIG